MRIARQGFRYIGFFVAVGVAVVALAPSPLYSIPFFVLAAFIVYFFRDPDRVPPPDEKLLVSPGDGKVVYVGAGEREPERQQISIFLSIFDVHINRSPLRAVVRRIRYSPGKFLAAYNSDAGSQNEQNELELVDGDFTVIVRQIAGVVARRIVCARKENDELARGERFGLIQFGSRMEIILPKESNIRVGVGDRVRGGETVIAERP